MTGRPITHGAKRLTLQERVNIEAGEDELSDSDGLDIVPSAAKEGGISFNEYFDSLHGTEEQVEISDDSVESAKASGRGQKRSWEQSHGADKGERIAFSDDQDSDTVYQDFKKRKSIKRKNEIAATKRAKARVDNGKIVGKRPKSVLNVKDGKRNRRERVYGDETDEDEALMETTLPDYLRHRRDSWAKRRDRLGNAGLKIPPDFEDVEFSEEERLENLKERPQLPGQRPRNPYKDIELRKSAGLLPAPIAQWLRDYQIEGAEFLHTLFVYQEGGILGDDMGLGKTIQVIAFLTAAFGKTGDERDDRRMRKMRRMGDDRWYPRILLICPGSLMANWQNELDRWGWWSTYVFHGNAAAKEAALAAAHKGRLEIMITTYSSYRINASQINGIRWDAVIADECHQIKEREAEITKALNDVNALCRIGLTGTAIQNKYEELWTLLNWTSPGRLGPMSVWKQAIALPLKLGQSHDATVGQLANARSTATKLVDNLLPRFLLRRMKSLIADQLPKKSDRVVFCPLTDTQAEAYNNFCDSELMRTIREASDPCPCGSDKKQGSCCYTHVEIGGRSEKWQHFVFPCLITLQKLSNHVALLIPSGLEGKEKEDKEIDKLEIACPNTWRELYRQRDSIMNYANQDFCGKWRILKKLLKLWHDSGDKVLVFSHSVRLLKMLNMLFKTTSYNVSYLDGSMSYPDRQKTVDDYNADPGQFVFLISTRAGGVGLNITSANKVVVVDPNWNPAYDLQAQDRAYRIGQTRDVEVFRLVSAGSVEEIVYARQIYKQQQANIGYNASLERRYFKGVQDQKEMKGEIFGLANLFKPQSENVVLRDIVNKTNIAETRAGIEIAGLDLEAPQNDDDYSQFDDDRETAAISQLAQEIVDAPSARKRKLEESKRKKDPVQAILASVGVEYTHENTEVIGTSKIETKISSRAQKAGNDFEWGRETAFAKSSQAEEINLPGHPHAMKIAENAEGGAEVYDGDKIKYRYRPPEEVRKRQFCTMAKGFGYDDITEFALVVEGWTQEQRRNCLDKFYAERKVKLLE